MYRFGKPEGHFVGRAAVRDMLTFESIAQGTRVIDGVGTMQGKKFDQPLKMHDGRVCDSTGAFLVGELERLDLTLHGPLAAVTWGRDIKLRGDVTVADEISSFTNSTFGSVGGLGTGAGIGTGKAWIGKVTNEIASVSVDISKTPQPLRPWALEIKFSILELESSARLGRPIDAQQYEGLKLKHAMDTDEQVYYGDVSFGDKGMLNNAGVTPQNVSTVGGNTTWATKGPDDILADVNTALSSNWQNAAWAVLPGEIRIPPAQYSQISTQKVSNAGNVSVLKYVLENNIVATQGGGAKLNILPLKWCIGAGASGTIGVLGTVDRMLVYVNEYDRVRYPMTLLQRTAIQYESIYHKTTYYGRLGVVEMPYPETVGYYDGL